MKGKARLTLCDAKSGRVISQTEECNMVTNAINRLFAPPRQGMFGQWDMAAMLGGYLPMYKNLLGGIMLLGNAVKEDADDFMLPAAVNPVGFAGDAYSGSNVMRGSLNLNESYETENGYHFTWDFATDKANGTIRCIALTNRLFGNVGFNETETADGAMLFDPLTPASAASSPRAFLGGGQLGYVVGCFSSNTFTFALFNANKLTLRTFTHPLPQGLKINDSAASFRYADAVAELPFNTDGNGWFFVNPADERIYCFSCESTGSDSTTLRYCAPKVTDPQDMIQGSVTLPYLGYTTVNAAVYNGQVYVMTNSGTRVFTMDGALLRSYDAAIQGHSRFFVHNGAIMSWICKNGGNYCQNFSCEGEVITYGLPMKLCYAPAIKPPYAIAQYTDRMSRSYAALMCCTNYMATINNLSQPLTKTASQTLKIEYDIMN